MNLSWLRDWMICREAGTYHPESEKILFWMDAVLLSGFAKAKPGDNVLDIGTGTGVIPILMAAKTKAGHFTGLEISMRVRIWRCEAFGIIIWKSESLL